MSHQQNDIINEMRLEMTEDKKMSQIQETIKLLKSLDQDQLWELLKDIDDGEMVEFMQNVINSYLQDKAERKRDEKNREYDGKSEYDEWKQIDDARRNSELTNGRF